MTNENRLEEILYQAHQRGDLDVLEQYMFEYRRANPNLRMIDYYDMAHIRIKKELGIIKT
jgi:hypothetical protein